MEPNTKRLKSFTTVATDALAGLFEILERIESTGSPGYANLRHLWAVWCDYVAPITHQMHRQHLRSPHPLATEDAATRQDACALVGEHDPRPQHDEALAQPPLESDAMAHFRDLAEAWLRSEVSDRELIDAWIKSVGGVGNYMPAEPASADPWHQYPMPTETPPEGTRWVRCYQRATGPEQRPGWRWEPIDLGVSDLVEQLQRGPGLPLLVTSASCEGHGQHAPHVLLADGRVLLVGDRSSL